MFRSCQRLTLQAAMEADVYPREPAFRGVVDFGHHRHPPNGELPSTGGSSAPSEAFGQRGQWTRHGGFWPSRRMETFYATVVHGLRLNWPVTEAWKLRHPGFSESLTEGKPWNTFDWKT